jgi:hypothetical protein
VEPRFAVLAGHPCQALSRRRPRCSHDPSAVRAVWRTAVWRVAVWRTAATLCLMFAALAAVASSADARPKRKDARVAFDRGVTAYKKGNYPAAVEALAKSFAIEGDVETLFAWAQAERKLERCDNALELYEKLLTFELSAANKEAVNGQVAECKAQLAAEHKAEPPPSEPPVPPVTPATPPTPGGETSPLVGSQLPSEPPRPDTPPHRAWYKNPVVLGLTGSGLIAAGVGGGFLLSAQSADGKIKDAKTYSDFQSLVDTAKSHGQIGLITIGVGGALVVSGVVWAIVTRDSSEQHVMTGWLAPGGGGLALAGWF